MEMASASARLAERIRTLIEAEKFQFNGTPVPVTCSFGVAEIQTFNELPAGSGGRISLV